VEERRAEENEGGGVERRVEEERRTEGGTEIIIGEGKVLPGNARTASEISVVISVKVPLVPARVTRFPGVFPFQIKTTTYF
jgi:hypothetical protein